MTELSDVTAVLEELGYEVRAAAEDELELSLSGDAPDQKRATAVRLAGNPEGNARLLMLSTSYEFDAGPTSLDDLRLAASEATQYLVLGHFEVDDDSSLHLRYSMLVDADAPLQPGVLSEVVSLVDFQQQHFGDYLELVITGDQDLAGFAALLAAGEASQV